MRRPYLTKSIFKDVEDVEVIDALLKEIGTVRLFCVGVLSMNDVVGVHGMVANKYYSGLTVVLQPIKVYYDKWGLPYYRFKRFSPPTLHSDYLRFKNPGVSWEMT